MEQHDHAKGMHKIMEIHKITTLDLKKKSHIWIVDGDENSKFFHGHINRKNRKNRVNGLLINGRWTSNFDERNLEAHRFFGDKFTESQPNRPKLLRPHFRYLSLMATISLEAPISVDEIKNVVWACGSERPPDPLGSHLSS